MFKTLVNFIHNFQDQKRNECPDGSPPRKRKSPGFCQFLLVTIVTVARKIYDFIVDRIFNFIYSGREIKRIPPVSDPLLKESAVSLAEKIRAGEVRIFRCGKLGSPRSEIKVL